MPRTSTGSTNASLAFHRCAMWNGCGNPPRKALAFELSRWKGKHFTTSSAFLSSFAAGDDTLHSTPKRQKSDARSDAHVRLGADRSCFPWRLMRVLHEIRFTLTPRMYTHSSQPPL